MSHTTEQTQQDTTPAAAGRRAWLGLAILMLPTLLIAMDFTVLHLAGNYGSGMKGAHAREKVEEAALQNVPSGGMRRRYSFGQYSKKPQFNKLPTTGVRTYYDGGMATVLGVRSKNGAWAFYGQRYAQDAFDSVTAI